MISHITNMILLYQKVAEKSFTIYSTECMERKKSEHIQEGTNIPIPLYNLSLSTCLHNINFLCYTVVEVTFTKNMERKKKEYREEQTGEGSFSIPRCNLSLPTCIPNMKFLS